MCRSHQPYRIRTYRYRHVRGDAEPAPLQFAVIVTAKLLGEHCSSHPRPVSVSCAALNCKAMRLSTSRIGDFAIAHSYQAVGVRRLPLFENPITGKRFPAYTCFMIDSRFASATSTPTVFPCLSDGPVFVEIHAGAPRCQSPRCRYGSHMLADAWSNMLRARYAHRSSSAPADIQAACAGCALSPSTPSTPVNRRMASVPLPRSTSATSHRGATTTAPVMIKSCTAMFRPKLPAS